MICPTCGLTRLDNYDPDNDGHIYSDWSDNIKCKCIIKRNKENKIK